jgi:hypothetical protein
MLTRSPGYAKFSDYVPAGYGARTAVDGAEGAAAEHVVHLDLRVVHLLLQRSHHLLHKCHKVSQLVCPVHRPDGARSARLAASLTGVADVIRDDQRRWHVFATQQKATAARQ